MSERPLEQLTLREMVISAEHLIRELSMHLEQAFLPKVNALEKMVAAHATQDECSLVQDVTVRNQAALVLQSDEFSQRLYKKLNDCLAAIERGTNQALSES